MAQSLWDEPNDTYQDAYVVEGNDFWKWGDGEIHDWSEDPDLDIIGFRASPGQLVTISLTLEREWWWEDEWGPPASSVALHNSSGEIAYSESDTGSDELQAYAQGDPFNTYFVVIGRPETDFFEYDVSIGAFCDLPPDETMAGSAYADVIYGLDGDDVLFGHGDADFLSGGTGTDRLLGGDGGDRLDGGDGPDTLNGDGGSDTLIGGAGSDTLHGGDAADSLTGGDGADIVKGGGGADALRGEEGDDRLCGDKGNDLLDGGAGADTLVGGKGADTLAGGDGRDVFRFDSAPQTGIGEDHRDVITDFSTAAGDRIDLHLVQSFVFIGGASFSAAAGELRAIDLAGDKLVQGDVDGDGHADSEILLQGCAGQVLVAGDFSL